MEERTRNRLEAVKLLKQQYDINSQNAFNYLKCEQNYENFRQQLIKEGIKKAPHHRTLANICQNINFVVEQALSLKLAKKRWDKESISSQFIVVADRFNERIFCPKEVKGTQINWTKAVKEYLSIREGGWDASWKKFGAEIYKKDDKDFKSLIDLNELRLTCLDKVYFKGYSEYINNKHLAWVCGNPKFLQDLYHPEDFTYEDKFIIWSMSDSEGCRFL